MAKEIERKFLVRTLDPLRGLRGDRIVQGYVAKEPGAVTTRVRIREDRAFLTLKGPREGITRDEFEYPIPLDDARQLLEKFCGRRVVRKTRYLVPHPPHVIEVDVFEGRHAGLVIAEVELPTEHAALSLPAWIGDEITYDTRFGNFCLANEAFMVPRDHLFPPPDAALPSPAHPGLPATPH
ncbi:MAG: CYTH domain-containing protein [Rhodocyclaceae bacterium]